MPACNLSLVIVCTGVCFAGVQLCQAQEATSANLPDQFQTGDMIQMQKSKKKKAEAKSPTVATATKEETAPVPEQMPAVEEVRTQIAPVEEKKRAPDRNTASLLATQKPETPTELESSAEEPAVVPVRHTKKTRPSNRRRLAPAAQPEAPSISEPVPMSLSVAQSMAITAPLPEYTYDMKRRNLTGSGVCIVTVDSATGTVTGASMFQTTGNSLLDKLTTQTFRNWRFKPGSVSQVRIPISYE